MNKYTVLNYSFVNCWHNLFTSISHVQPVGHYCLFCNYCLFGSFRQTNTIWFGVEMYWIHPFNYSPLVWLALFFSKLSPLSHFFSFTSSQVSLQADLPCRFVAWRRKKLYLFFAKHRYIARIFALIVRNDIAEKLYSLNNNVFDTSGHHYDIRLPNNFRTTATIGKTDTFLQVGGMKVLPEHTHTCKRSYDDNNHEQDREWLF